jgi:multicomponent Na+:H+ antiporter subunit G
MTEVLAYLSGVLILIGTLFSVLAAIGILRFPDVYTRIHAASKAGVVGAGLIFCGVVAASGDPALAIRGVFGLLFLVLTTPVSAHLLARAAYFAGFRPAPVTSVTELGQIRNNSP